jgi:chromosome partitioning protein
MKTVALVAQKGGTGKSTLAIHLAVCASLRGKSVALVELDNQDTIKEWRAVRASDDLEVVSARAQDLPRLMAEAKKQRADLVILDTAGRADTIAEQVIAAADVVLIPCRPFANDLRATPRTVAQVKAVKKKGQRAFIVLNSCPVQGTRHEEARGALETLLTLAPVDVHYYMAFADALNDGRSVEEYDPKSKASQEIGALYDWMMLV